MTQIIAFYMGLKFFFYVEYDLWALGNFSSGLVVYGRKEMERQARTAHKIDTEKWPFHCRVYMGM